MCIFFVYFFFNDTATTEIYTLSLHDALPISPTSFHREDLWRLGFFFRQDGRYTLMVKFADSDLHRVASDSANWAYSIGEDRKSTRLNSSHANISYAVFCLKKKKI